MTKIGHYRLVVFDCDGTLVDSQHNIIAAMVEAWRRHGLTDPTPDLIRRQVGLTLEIAIDRMLGGGDPVFVSALANTYRDIVHDLRQPSRAMFYVPNNERDDKSSPRPVSFATFIIHTDAQNSLALSNSLRQLIAQRHNGLRVSNVTTQLDLYRDQTIRERLIAMLAAFFAAVALLLAGIGLYAVLNYSVLQRRREIGIRMAIGSPRTGIVRLVTLDVFAMIALGACAGLALGFGAAQYVASLIYQVKATDGEMVALPACAILLTALIATLPAVLRALRTDPTEILRIE